MLHDKRAHHLLSHVLQCVADFIHVYVTYTLTDKRGGDHQLCCPEMHNRKSSTQTQHMLQAAVSRARYTTFIMGYHNVSLTVEERVGIRDINTGCD